jgi:hypothetical protein
MTAAASGRFSFVSSCNAPSARRRDALGMNGSRPSCGTPARKSQDFDSFRNKSKVESEQNLEPLLRGKTMSSPIYCDLRRR